MIIDITHAIPAYDIITGAWVLRQAAPYFPPSNHVAVVDPGVGTARRGIAVECARGDMLIGPDNGLLVPASEVLGGIVSVVELADPQFRRLPVSNTFHGRDIFCPAAAHLMHGVSLHLLGPRLDPAGLIRLPERKATAENGVITTAVATTNEFGSLALTAPAALLEKLGNPSYVAFTIADQTQSARVVRTFGEAPVGAIVAFADSYGYITLAINQDSLAAMLGITRRDHPPGHSEIRPLLRASTGAVIDGRRRFTYRRPLPTLDRAPRRRSFRPTTRHGLRNGASPFSPARANLPPCVTASAQSPKVRCPESAEAFNAAKQSLEEAFEVQKGNLGKVSLEHDLAAETIDVTLPGRAPTIGYAHPVRETLQEIIRIFGTMGFSVAEGPEVESDRNNFELLNIPSDHPARDTMDTFYIDVPGGILLRTHTSPVQARVMLSQDPPVRIISPGRCFRRDQEDASHLSYFWQCEGLAVDRDVTFSDLKGVLASFADQILGCKVRFRPHHFQFTEPSAEFDFSCLVVRRKGLPRLQVRRLAGDQRGRDGASPGAAQRRLRSCRLQRVCLRHGSRAHRHDALRDQRYSPAQRQRSAIPPPIRLTVSPIN